MTAATYQVFLSFRGPDTRQGFADVLYHELRDAGIRVFRDNEEIRKGEEIGVEILRAIEESRVFVPIFSREYASSKWCLGELTKMVKSKNISSSSSGKKILPIFYDVGVDDVKLKTELYSGALKEHSKTLGSETVRQWEEALREAGQTKGWELKDTGHGEFARSFVRDVSMKLKVKHKLVTEYFVQRDYQVEALMKLLDVESSDVRFVGVYGMGGIGKSTLAKVIFNKLCDHFDCCSFLDDVRETSGQHKGIQHLQKQLLHSLSLETGEIMDVDDGIRRMREMLVQKKFLLVLDDVDHRRQVDYLAGDGTWFGPGSRIIITTRDQRVLETKRQTIQTLEVEEMKPEEAGRLLCMHAFQNDSCLGDRLSLLEEVVASTGRLPLALEVIGSHLCGKPYRFWVDTIKRLKKIPHRDVQEKLMISFEVLDPQTKQIFLDIACFFIGYEKTYPTYMWEACDFDPKMGLKELIYMSLVKVIAEDARFSKGIKRRRLWMHDQLRDLGRKIVCDERFKGTVRRSRLWRSEDALEMLHEEEEGKGSVEMLRLHCDRSTEGYTFTPSELSSLGKLRYLECFGANFSGELRHVLPKLRWLSWHNCPPILVGTDLCLRNLVILDLSWSHISENWSGWAQIGVHNVLRVLNLRGCNKLRKTPDLSTYSSLEMLILAYCDNLVEIDPSISKLKRLKYLDVSHCDSLKSFAEVLYSLHGLEVILRQSHGSYQERLDMTELIGDADATSLLILDLHSVQIVKFSQSIGDLTRLRRLSLARCSGLEILPDTLGDMKSLVELDLRESDVSELPQGIGRLVKLELLYLHGCVKVKELPVSIGDLESLVRLDISRSGIAELPETIGNLKKLRVFKMRWSKIKKLPASIGMLERLEELDASFTQIAEIPSTIEGLTCLRVLNLKDIFINGMPPKPPSGLEGIGKLSRLVDLRMSLRNVTCIPEEFSSLSQLQRLTLGCPNVKYCPPLPSGLSTLVLVGLEEKTKLPRLSNLKKLLTLEFRWCRIRDDTAGNLGVGEVDSLKRLSLLHCEFRNLGMLHLPEHLHRLEIQHCKLLKTLPTLSHPKNLKEFKIEKAEELVEIPELGRLISLQELDISYCYSLERLPNLSHLERLRRVYIYLCKKFKGIDDGIFKLKSLELLRIGSCDCEDVFVDSRGRKRRFEELD